MLNLNHSSISKGEYHLLLPHLIALSISKCPGEFIVHKRELLNANVMVCSCRDLRVS